MTKIVTQNFGNEEAKQVAVYERRARESPRWDVGVVILNVVRLPDDRARLNIQTEQRANRTIGAAHVEVPIATDLPLG